MAAGRSTNRSRVLQSSLLLKIFLIKFIVRHKIKRESLFSNDSIQDYGSMFSWFTKMSSFKRKVCKGIHVQLFIQYQIIVAEMQYRNSMLKCLLICMLI